MVLKKILGESPDPGRSAVFMFFAALILLHHLFAITGLYGFDDINYARYAASIASRQGSPLHSTDHFELRWVTIYVTAFFYKLFGINDLASSAFALITIILAGYLIKRLLANAPVWIYTLALVLYFLNYQVLFATHRVWPDTGVCFFGFGAFYFYLLAYSGKKQMLNALAGSLFLFLTMLTKETVLLFLPLLIFLLTRDLLKKQLLRFWAFAFAFSAIFLFVYLAIFRINTGDWLYRYHLLQSNSYINDCSFDQLSMIYTVKRITYASWHAFLLDGGLIFLIAGFCGFVYRSRIMPGAVHRQIAVAFFVLLLSANFMTFSYKNYLPLCHDTRHFLFLFPFAAISGAFMLKAYFDNPLKYWLLPALTGASTIAIFIVKGGEMKYIYLLVCLVLLIPIIIRNHAWWGRPDTFIFLLFGCFVIRPMYDVVHREKAYYYHHKKLILSTFPGELSHATIYTADDFTAELSEYFLSFNTGFVQFRNLGRTTSLPGELKADTYFLINTLYNPRLSEVLHGLLTIDKKTSLSPVKKEHGVILYKVNYLPVLDSLKQKADTRL